MSNEQEDNFSEAPSPPPTSAIDGGDGAPLEFPEVQLAESVRTHPGDRVHAGTIVAAVLGLVAAWIAAGSIGLVGHALRIGLTWLALGGALLAVLRDARHERSPGLRIRLFDSRRPWGPSLALVAVLCGTGVAVAMTASGHAAVNVLAVPVLLGVLAATEPGPGRAVLRTAAEGTFVFALYRLALGSLPAVWLAADVTGGLLGRLAGGLSGVPLWVGATFAGIDFLVLTLYVLLRTPFAFAAIGKEPPSADTELPGAGVTIETTASAASRGGWRWPLVELSLAVLAMAALHIVFLVILSYAARGSAELPTVPPPDPNDVQFDSPREFVHTLRNLTPWNVLAVACLFHALVAAAHFAWWSWWRCRRPGGQAAGAVGPARVVLPAPRIPWPAAVTVVVAFAVGVALTVQPSWDRPADLDGKKIVLLEEGYLNWSKPVHGDYGSYSIGMYGMFPVYIESFGAECVVSPDLSESDLRDADLLVLIYPDKPWKEGQLQRIWDFVREGGSLLVMGEHTILESDVPEEKGGNRFNEVLEPTGMRVRFDSATFEVGGWLQSYQALAHPTSAGIRDEENEFGAVIGASLETRWPARPLLVGRWGWADPGDANAGPSMMGNNKYDPGERLGDMVLAAEQPLGKGKVIAFGDTSGLTNGLTVGCHVFTSRLLAYLAERENRPPGMGMLLLAVGCCLVLTALVAWRREAWFVSAAAAAIGFVIVVHTAHVYAQGTVLADTNKLTTPYDLLDHSILAPAQEAVAEIPTGEDEAESPEIDSLDPADDAAETLAAQVAPRPDHVRPYRLAYIDGAHLNAFSPEGWRDDGIMGLCLTLMREGYLTLLLPEITEERLRGATLLVSIAPSRQYSETEQEAIEQFIRDGGLFIYMIGREHYAAGKSLLERLRFRVGLPNWDDEGKREPVPCSHFKTPYFEGDGYEAFVRFYAAWPVACLDDPSRRLLVTQRAGLTPEEPVFPLIEIRRCGEGLIAVIGDSAFATNQNLEREDGTPIEGLRENADFWRWLLNLLRTGEVRWVPPQPEPVDFGMLPRSSHFPGSQAPAWEPLSPKLRFERWEAELPTCAFPSWSVGARSGAVALNRRFRGTKHDSNSLALLRREDAS